MNSFSFQYQNKTAVSGSHPTSRCKIIISDDINNTIIIYVSSIRLEVSIWIKGIVWGNRLFFSIPIRNHIDYKLFKLARFLQSRRKKQADKCILIFIFTSPPTIFDLIYYHGPLSWKLRTLHTQMSGQIKTHIIFYL